MRRCEFEVEGLSVYRVVDKLRTAGILVISAQKTQKNGIRIAVDGKDRKKVFAILQGSCYNVVKVRSLRLERLVQASIRSLGIFLGGLLGLGAVLFFQGRVLRITVCGSGSYYEAEVLEILSRGGVKVMSPAPKKTAALTSEILSLPRVSFCTIKAGGGVLTVTVEVSDEGAPLVGAALVSPATGTLEELIVLRGTALFAVGDAVNAGDVLVADYATYGNEQRRVLVIARAKVQFSVSTEYALGEAAALAQAYLDFGELTQIHTQQTESGWLVEGTAHSEVSINFG